MEVVVVKIGSTWGYVITKYGYPPSVPDIIKGLRETKALGFDSMEIEGLGKDNLLAVYAVRKELKDVCDQEGLYINNFSPILPNLASMDSALRAEARDLYKRAIEIASFFGCSTLLGDSFPPPLKFRGDVPYKKAMNYGGHFAVEVDTAFRWDRQWDVLVESCSFCAEEAGKAGLLFCIEPRVGEMLSNTDSLLRMIDAVPHKSFGAVLDAAHLYAQKEILPLSVEKLGKRIFSVHVADNDGKTNEHLAPGRGTVDWDGLFQALKKHGYSGYFAVDVLMVPDLEEQYRESLVFLKEMERKHSM